MKHNSATSSLNILLISFLAVLAIWRAIEFKDKHSSPKNTMINFAYVRSNY